MSLSLNRRHTLKTALAGLALGTGTVHAATKVKKAMPLIIAHRGASGYRPEHTQAAYELAIQMGADYIEPDLVATKDGHMVVRHDPILADSTDIAAHPEFADRKRTLNLGGYSITDWFVSDFTLAEIKTLRARQVFPARDHSHDDTYPILTVEEVIDIAKAGTKTTGRTIGIAPEIKWPSLHQKFGLPIEARLVDTLKRANLNNASSPVIIQSFEQANLKALKTMTPVTLLQLVSGSGLDPVTGQVVLKAPDDKPFDWTVSGRAGTYADMLTPEGLDEVATYASVIAPWKGWLMGFKGQGEARTQIRNQTLIDNAHARGLKVCTWTLRNDPDRLDPYFKGNPQQEFFDFWDMGLDLVFTDFPDTGVAARAAYLKR